MKKASKAYFKVQYSTYTKMYYWQFFYDDELRVLEGDFSTKKKAKEAAVRAKCLMAEAEIETGLEPKVTEERSELIADLKQVVHHAERGICVDYGVNRENMLMALKNWAKEVKAIILGHAREGEKEE